MRFDGTLPLAAAQSKPKIGARVTAVDELARLSGKRAWVEERLAEARAAVPPQVAVIQACESFLRVYEHNREEILRRHPYLAANYRDQS